MFIIKWVIIMLIGLVVSAIAAAQFGAFSGQTPSDLGVRDGRLKPPSLSNNSVSSQALLYPAHPMVAAASVEPLPFHTDAAATMSHLQSVVAALPGARIVKSESDYLYAQVTTPLMRFVDDVEFWLDPADKVVHVRSASRIGEEDLGVNRARVEAIRQALASP